MRLVRLLSGQSRAVVRLYTGGKDCQLCTEAIELLDSVQEVDFDLEVVDIRTDSILKRQYQ